MSTGLIIIGCLLLIVIVMVQIGKVTELAANIRGEEEEQYETNRRGGNMMLFDSEATNLEGGDPNPAVQDVYQRVNPQSEFSMFYSGFD